MTPTFDLDASETIEFGIGREAGDARAFRIVPVDGDLKAALTEMARETFRQMALADPNPPRFDPAEEQSSRAYQQLPLQDDLAASLREVFATDNFDFDRSFGDDLTDVFCYFARFTSEDGSRLLCLRRAAQFKAMRTKQGRIAFLESLGASDTLSLFPDQLFQLNDDFDVAIDNETVHIINPKSLKVLAQIDNKSMAAVAANMKHIRDACPYVRWDTIEAYASTKARVAALIASIRSAGHAENISKSRLVEACLRAGIPVLDDGKVAVPDNHVQEFLEILNRRRYEVDLVETDHELYVASARRRASS